jgi:hypothetical protein
MTYGFEKKEIKIEGCISCKFDISDKITPGDIIGFGVKLGFHHTKKNY